MARPRPEPDPRARGLLRAWVSGAMLWSATTRTTINADGLGERYLAFVAFYLCIKEASLLIDGNEYGDIPGDPVARGDCPVDPRELRKLRDRLRGFRDEVLHLSDKNEEGRSLDMTWTAARPYFTFRSSVGRSTLSFDEISKPEVESILDELDPWLRRHWDRLIDEDDTEESNAALAAKIDATMSEAGGDEVATLNGRRQRISPQGRLPRPRPHDGGRVGSAVGEVGIMGEIWPDDDLVAQASGLGMDRGIVILPRADGQYSDHATDVINLLREAGVPTEYASDPMEAGVHGEKDATVVLPALLILGNVADVASAIDGIVWVVRWFLGHRTPSTSLHLEATRVRNKKGDERTTIKVDLEGGPDLAEEIVREALAAFRDDPPVR